MPKRCREKMEDNCDIMANKETNAEVLSEIRSSDIKLENASLQEIPASDIIYESPTTGLVAADERDAVENLVQRTDSKCELSKNISVEVTPEIGSLDSGMGSTFADAIELPSDVTDRKEIFMPLDTKNDDPRIYGKWMLFTDGDLCFQDYLWTKLQALLLSGDVILLASSTARKCRDRGRFQGVIKCYTCEDKEVIKRAGIAIQGFIKDDIILNYKTNQASKDSLYRGHGDRFITQYMLTVNGKLYEKDKLDRWKQVTDIHAKISTQGESSTSISPQVYLTSHGGEQSSGSELYPSQEIGKKRYIYPIYASLNNFSGVWCLFCNVSDDVECSGMTELDYIWKETKTLCDERFFVSVSCETYAFQPRPGENPRRRTITCQLEDYFNVDRIIESGEKLRQRTMYNFPMYFKLSYLNDKGRIKFSLKYLYTDEKELYEYAHERWRLLKRN